MEAVKDLIDDGMCFVCGPRNDLGLGLKFAVQGEDMVAEFLPQVHHQGFQGVVHGGLISTLLDEVMAHVLIHQGKKAVTAKMEVRFKQMARVGERLAVSGRLQREKGRMLELDAEVRTAAGELVATATGTWIRFEPEE